MFVGQVFLTQNLLNLIIDKQIRNFLWSSPSLNLCCSILIMQSLFLLSTLCFRLQHYQSRGERRRRREARKRLDQRRWLISNTTFTTSSTNIFDLLSGALVSLELSLPHTEVLPCFWNLNIETLRQVGIWTVIPRCWLDDE